MKRLRALESPKVRKKWTGIGEWLKWLDNLQRAEERVLRKLGNCSKYSFKQSV